MSGYWWPARRDDEATADYLARVLDELGAGELAVQARACHFDDFRCPPDVDDGMNIHRLVHGVRVWAGGQDETSVRRRAMSVIDAAVAGEFDSTAEESRAWAESPEGQTTFRELMGP